MLILFSKPWKIHGKYDFQKKTMKIAIGLLALLVLGTQFVMAEDLAAGFVNPPASAKAHTWWHWMNGNITKEGITADLEAMARVGVGGAQIFNVDCGILPGPVSFFSPEWRELMKHAAQEANRLGLELCIMNGPGWSNSGGPWITPEHAMQQVTISETQIKGPTHFSEKLPRPATKLDFYRDIEVLAFPTPASEAVTMQELAPAVTTSLGKVDGGKLWDGKHETAVVLPLPGKGIAPFIQFEFTQPLAARSAKIMLGPGAKDPRGVIQISADGKTFRDLAPFSFPRSGGDGSLIIALDDNSVPAKFYRVKFTAGGLRTKKLAIVEVAFSPSLRIGDVSAKSGMNRGQLNDDVSAARVLPPPNLAVKHEQIINLTDRAKPDGQLEWDAPAGDWTVLRIGYTPTGVQNHPAPKGGAGLECDKLNAAGMDAQWQGFLQKIIDDLGPLAGKGKTFNNALIDSYEVGGQNWTANFREEFQARRGYDPLLWLVTFTGRVVDSPDLSERFLWDVRRTIADLFAEKYFGHLAELCHQHGLLASYEPYTGPFESLQCGSADIPMGEFWAGQRMHHSVKLASSIGHIYGRPIIGAESFTATPLFGKWLTDPYAIKALGDAAFCQGINRYIFHRYAMQPWTNRWPGMTMGPWGTHFERTLTWWEQGRAWLKYIARSQYLLQQGLFAADVAVFFGESAPADMPSKPQLPVGYDYDGINAGVLLDHARVEAGQLVLDSGMRYHVLLLDQQARTMTPPLLRKLRDLAAAGLTIVGAPPESSPSLNAYPKCDTEVKTLVAELWGNCNGKTVTAHSFGKGQAIWGQPLEQVLTGLKTPPDFTFNPAAELKFIHRHAGDAEIYFVSNQRDNAQIVDCTFRVSGKQPELWHPDTGVMEKAPVFIEQNGRTTVPLHLDPAGSVFVVFRQPATEHLIAAKFTPSSNADVVTCLPNDQPAVCAWQPGVAEVTTAAGKTVKMEVNDVPAPREISGPWELSFPPNWGAPAKVTLEKLISWPDHADTGVKYFSGTASYKKEFDFKSEISNLKSKIFLDLGLVKNIAEVKLNGHDLGILWKPPFRIEITDALRDGQNELEVRVTNLWPNRLIGDAQLPDDVEWGSAGPMGSPLKKWPQWVLDGKPSPTGRLTFTTWHHWKKGDKLWPSGLLGPVQVQTAVQIPVQP